MKYIEIGFDIQSLTTAKDYIEERLVSMNIPKSSIEESSIVFEELFIEAVHHNNGKTKEAYLAVVDRFGEVSIKLYYEGKRFQIDEIEGDELSSAVINGFREKLFTDYRKGYNTISIRVRNSRHRKMVMYASIFLLATVALLLIPNLSPRMIDLVYDHFVYPAETLLLNAMLLISTPLAFFCLVKNVVTLISVNRRQANARKIIANVILQSLTAIGLSIIVGLLVQKSQYSPYESFYSQIQIADITKIVSTDYVGFFFPSSLGDFFTLKKPFAFISLAIITALAICNSGEYFDSLQRAIDSISGLLCKILNIVLTLLPIVYFAAVLDDVREDSIANHIVSYCLLFLFTFGHFVALFVINCIRIKIRGGKPIQFVKDSMPAIRENILIGSTIDAVPYNVRYFSRIFKVPIRQLNDNLPIYAQVSQVGNCLCYTILSITFMRFCNVPLNVLNITILIMMSFFLGIGAPGQQGSILSGTIIINSFLGFHIKDMIAVYIISEVLFGQIASFFNTWDGIVNMYIQHLQEEKKTSL